MKTTPPPTQDNQASAEAAALLAAARRVASRIVREASPSANYRNDLAWESLLALTAASGEPEWRNFVHGMLPKRGLSPDVPVSYLLEPFGSLTYALFLDSGDRRWLSGFLAETELCRRDMPRSVDGLVMHPRGEQRGGGDAVLLDSMQEYVVRMVRGGVHLGDPSYLREAVEQLRLHRDLLRNPVSGLWSQGRGWLSRGSTVLSPGAWSRGHGWVVRGITSSLAVLPGDCAEAAEMRAILAQMAEALLAVQRPDGLWPTLLHRPHPESPSDTSGTALIATAFSRACREGWLKGAPFRESAMRAFRALPALVDDDGVVLGVSPGPGPLESEEDYLRASFPPGNDHGLFTLIFAAAEALQEKALS